MPRKAKLLVLHHSDDQNATLSYQSSWLSNLLTSNLFKVKPINLTHDDADRQIRRSLFWLGYDFIVLLHSAFSNSSNVSRPIMDMLRDSRLPKVYFIGNEYKLMAEKMNFCDSIGIDLLISQANSDQVKACYHDRLGCKVDYLPNTGLDENIYRAVIPYENRPNDIGYRSYISPWYLGHDERTEIANYFRKHCATKNLRTDISLNPSDRFTPIEWAKFLNKCKAQIGTEAGGDYFELDDHTRINVNEYLRVNSKATFKEVYQKFFMNYPNPIPLRIMSSRNVESAGCKTLQILFEGYYNGHFIADEHYLALKKDFSNIDDVLLKFKDIDLTKRIVDNAYHKVMQELTFDKLCSKLHSLLQSLN